MSQYIVSIQSQNFPSKNLCPETRSIFVLKNKVDIWVQGLSLEKKTFPHNLGLNVRNLKRFSHILCNKD